ncbi:signal transduction histidine kinase [Cohnella lupini]|uniref:histidine kinase n=2 Tax=Cohnella lupini TaxID=1294267 RepID=A0A3D9I8T8_9BACL|nr:signal transduction histidine kinase [Cohnella lupini]
MKSVHGITILRIFVLFIMIFTYSTQFTSASEPASNINEWQMKWIGKADDEQRIPALDETWIPTGSDNPLTNVPPGFRGMWVHFTIPSTMGLQRPGLLAERIYGLDLSVYRESHLLIQTRRDFTFDLNKLLMPIEQTSEPKDYYIRILTTSERAGLISDIRIDEIDLLSKRFIRQDLPDLLLGSSIVFLALIMLFCSSYLHRKQRSSWVALCLFSLSIGILIITYSPLTYIYFKEYGKILLLLFDVSLFLLIPSFNYYIDQVFNGQFRFFTKYRRLQAYYSAFCLVALIVYTISGQHYEVYYVILNIILSVLILLQLLLIIVLSILRAIKGSWSAILLSLGIILFASSATADLIFYYLSHRTYVLYLWKFGVVILILTLVIILARRISADYGKLLNYSKELEIYNHSLQRTEKMKIISDLAASVAHEVRNPLQVTRGFLQLLSSRTDEKNKTYFDLATNELDRASDIITDFLTFAKPDLETIVVLDMYEEMKKIEAMMTPMASMYGGVLLFKSQEQLYFRGNSSKLKQALINIIKNSIEAIGSDGWIKINADTEGEEVIVRIADNGDGMDDEEVAKLGIPFFSTKTKGTGLGLMVTFRIIEAMRGTIVFHSVKTKGTEVIIRFPLIVKDSELPNEIGA